MNKNLTSAQNETAKWAAGAANITIHMKKEKFKKEIKEAVEAVERAKAVLVNVRKKQTDFLEGL